MLVKNFPHDSVEIECAYCGRFGKYSKARFCEIVGEDTAIAFMYFETAPNPSYHEGMYELIRDAVDDAMFWHQKFIDEVNGFAETLH